MKTRNRYLCLFPYECRVNVANDEIPKSWPFRLVANPVFALVAQVFNFWLLRLLVNDLRFAAVTLNIGEWLAAATPPSFG